MVTGTQDSPRGSYLLDHHWMEEWARLKALEALFDPTTTARIVALPAAAEVVIAVEASPINQYDLLMIAGGYGYRPRLPAITGSSTHLRRRDQRPVADDNRRLRRKALGGFRRNREATTHEWRCRPSFQPPMLANDLMAKETA